MSVTRRLHAILDELAGHVSLIDDAAWDAALTEIRGARHIFLAGAGRSGVAIRGFANRLLHLGLSVSVVGEISSPHSAPGDLVIIGSGSGETGSLVALARKAKDASARLVLITMDATSTIGKLADVVVVLPGVSPKLKVATAVTSIQPMGTAFEQMSSLCYDAAVLELMDALGETSESMFPRHADFE